MTKRLTKAEEEIMLILWKLKEATIRDVINEFAVPNIPYTTISTVIRVMEKKELVRHKAVGTTFLYYPLLKKDEFLKGLLSDIVSKYFDGSYSRMAAFFAKQNDFALSDLKALMVEIENDLNESSN